MRVKVTNMRPVSVSVEGRSFRPRSVTEIEADERTIRHIGARYGLLVEAVVPDLPRGTPIAPGLDDARGTGQSMVGVEMVLGADGIARGELVVPALTCPTCGKVCKSDFGLKSHQRSHNKES